MESNELLTLDVGGEVFKTYYSTIKQSEYLRNLFTSKKEDRFASFTGENEIFLDRDSNLFSDIMLYLQTMQISLATTDIDYIKKLRLEAQFYRINSLVDKINAEPSNKRYYSVNMPFDEIKINTQALDTFSTETDIVSTLSYNSYQNKLINKTIISMKDTD